MNKDDPGRAQRLADALRANLRRRKTRSRAVEGADTVDSGDDVGLPPPLE